MVSVLSALSVEVKGKVMMSGFVPQSFAHMEVCLISLEIVFMHIHPHTRVWRIFLEEEDPCVYFAFAYNILFMNFEVLYTH